jgi:hypothetical protein
MGASLATKKLANLLQADQGRPHFVSLFHRL